MSSPQFRVMKFGGSSLGAPERILRALDIVVRERRLSRIALVVSAMGDSTDWLLEAVDAAAEGDEKRAAAVVDRIGDLATANALGVLQVLKARGPIVGPPPEVAARVRTLTSPLRGVLAGVSLLRESTTQTVDLVMSFGERLSAAMVADLLVAAGAPAVAVDSRDWTVTDANFGNANVLWELTQQKLDAMVPGWGEAVAVSTGFLGCTQQGRTTTLGRNGSDYTATLLARGLRASEVIRWTDVSGVMTADPDLVADAYPLARLSYMEALELANFGARVFHSRTMIPLIESGIPMAIRNTMRPEDPGTIIDRSGSTNEERPTSVTSLERLALIGLEWRSILIERQAHLGDRVLRALDEAGVNVWMANQAAHGQAVTLVIPVAEVAVARAAIEKSLRVELERGELEPLQVREPVTLLSLVAEAMGHTVNVAGRFFSALGGVGVNVRAIAQGASGRSIACVIDAEETATAVRTVHAAFNFGNGEVNLLLYGTGTVGASLIDQIREQQQRLVRDHGIRVRLVGVATTKWSRFEPNGIALDYGIEPTTGPDTAALRETDSALLDRLRKLPNPVLVDCTAADHMQALYTEALSRGIHVVAANKKPLAIPQSERNALLATADRNFRAYHYETTVGASLPVIETLKNIVRTGDRVLRVDGSFSGTLGYLTNAVMSGVALVDAVRTARELGYTEPNPADDLTGLDVARKALILARELGFSINIEDVAVTPLVPTEVLSAQTLDLLYEALSGYESAMRSTVEGLRAEAKTLRYLARIEPDGTSPAGVKVSVGPVGVDVDHPASRLRGTEALVAYTTERYCEYPLIVQGAGAGGPVTAAGVLADVLKIPSLLRGR